MRKKNGVYDKSGELTPVNWDEAFGVMAAQAKKVLKEKGPTALGMFGSGQWTIWEGYAATKLMRAGFRSNNLDPNARHCMASAAYAFMRTFGADEPMGCYDDFEAADAFVLWGSNMAEMHPILWTRLDRSPPQPSACEGGGALHIHEPQLRSRRHSHCVQARDGSRDPQLHRQSHHLHGTGEPGLRHQAHQFREGRGGYRLRAAARRSDRKESQGRGRSGATQPIDFTAYAAFVKDYTLEKVSVLSGVERGFLQELAELYADPSRKVMSLWTMGFNQHVRGVWANQLVYNLHLLTGKISEPGNSPFSLTGQPSACGTAREVGTFAHRLPADMTVTNPAHRKHAEELWRVPSGLIPEKPGYHAVEQDRMLHDGKLNFYWVQVNNNVQAAPNNSHETYPGYRNPENFVVVSDVYPTVTAMSADVVLPAAMWVEKEGAYGNAERRTHFWHQLVKAPGEARSDLWQMMEFSKRFTTDEVWSQDILDANPNYRGKTLFEVLYRNGNVDRFPLSETSPDYENFEIQDVRLLRAERIVRGIRILRARPWPRPCAVRQISRGARVALACGRRQGNALALSRGIGPLRQARRGDQVLWQRRRPGENHRRSL